MDTPVQDNNRGDGPPGTPPQPPYSPVTPVLSHSALIPSDRIAPLTASSTSMFDASTSNAGDAGGAESMRPPAFMPEPPPVPISESENPDAIALRSAISILQIQKQQSLRDIRTLDTMKKTAAAHPEEFVKQLTEGKLSAPDSGELLSFTSEEASQDEDDKGNEMEVDHDSAETSDPQKQESETQIDFGKIPKPQNVVRMPPINWAKYHIVGEPLDKLAEEQRRRPSSGEPRRDPPGESQRAPEHFIAAPYRPFVDKLEPPMRTRSSNKGKNA